MRTYGLIGFPLGHSFSPGYFSKKFEREGITNAEYRLFELPQIDALPALIANTPNLQGLNVTIPHKEVVLPFLDAIDPIAKSIGAVNTIRIQPHDGTSKVPGFWLEGSNTDIIGFRESVQPLLQPQHEQALIFGSGGSSKAVKAALDQLGIVHQTVSRSGPLTYADLTASIIKDHQLLINTTPLGTTPNEDTKVDIPYAALDQSHLLVDLVYNPPMTAFLQEGAKRNAGTLNGFRMLELQAEASWKIWTESG